MSIKHLSQVLALEKDAKSSYDQTLQKARAVFSHANLLSGFARVYTPKDEEGEQLPPESTRVQITARQVLNNIGTDLSAMIDLVATKEATNAHAVADLVVDDQILLFKVPATTLLFLEKRLQELLTFLHGLPVLDSSEHWTYDEVHQVWATDPIETLRQKKVPRNHVKAEATAHHPAQVEVYYEDVPVGRWRTTKYSGALPYAEMEQVISRVEKLMQATKSAREEANRCDAVNVQLGGALLRYIFE